MEHLEPKPSSNTLSEGTWNPRNWLQQFNQKGHCWPKFDTSPPNIYDGNSSCCILVVCLPNQGYKRWQYVLSLWQLSCAVKLTKTYCTHWILSFPCGMIFDDLIAVHSGWPGAQGYLRIGQSALLDLLLQQFLFDAQFPLEQKLTKWPRTVGACSTNGSNTRQHPHPQEKAIGILAPFYQGLQGLAFLLPTRQNLFRHLITLQKDRCVSPCRTSKPMFAPTGEVEANNNPNADMERANVAKSGARTNFAPVIVQMR